MSNHTDENEVQKAAIQKFREALPICFAAVGGSVVVMSGLLVASVPYPELATHMVHSFVGCVVAFFIVFGVAMSTILSGDHALVKIPFVKKPTHVFVYAVALAMLLSVSAVSYALVFIGEAQFLEEARFEP
ncbi:hypothetical protein [Tepidicaulis sp.]|uniref:hypothetical protein n=1 Tax=Tepidicaulis sp. TaxID=1920809 RepID=UPI003B593A68